MVARSIGLAATLAAAVSAEFSAQSSSNVAIYWGQGDAQITLPEVCSDETVDIVNLAFINEFPTAVGDYPGNNFANACEPEWYTLNGTRTKLSSNCPLIGPGIQKCHENGKKVFVSLGGGVPTNYSLPSREVAEYFADFLWGAFGPLTSEWKKAGKPRPFGDVSVDGFDLDLEAWIEGAASNEYQYINYDHFVNRLRSNYASSGGEYYISGAPQCVVPDSRLAYAIERSHFDFLFLQFYNTAQCNARRGYEGLGKSTTDFTFDAWVKWLDENSANQNAKIYLGLPASSTAAPSDPTSYLTPTEAEKLINTYRAAYPARFGGVMLWEVMHSIRNPICGKSYSSYIRSILDGTFKDEVCPSITSALPSSTSSAVPSPTAISPDGSCGPKAGYTCAGSSFGSCCSAYGYCGQTSIYCQVSEGCQSMFGHCGTASSSSSSVSIISSSTYSTAPMNHTTFGSSTASATTSASPPFPTGGNSTVVPGSTSIGLSTGSLSSNLPPFPISLNSTATAGATGTQQSIILSTGGLSPTTAPYPIKDNSTSVFGPTGTISSIAATTSFPTVKNSSSIVYGTSNSTLPAGSRSPTIVVPSSTGSSIIRPNLYTGVSGAARPSEASSHPVYSTHGPYVNVTVSAAGYGRVTATSYETVRPNPVSGYAAIQSGSMVSSSSVTSKATHTTSSVNAAATTVYTTTFVDICPTGLTTITTVITKTVCTSCATPTSKPAIPLGWTKTVTVCTACGATPTTVTLTKPVHAPFAPPSLPTHIPGSKSSFDVGGSYGGEKSSSVVHGSKPSKPVGSLSEGGATSPTSTPKKPVNAPFAPPSLPTRTPSSMPSSLVTGVTGGGATSPSTTPTKPVNAPFAPPSLPTRFPSSMPSSPASSVKDSMPSAAPYSQVASKIVTSMEPGKPRTTVAATPIPATQTLGTAPINGTGTAYRTTATGTLAPQAKQPSGYQATAAAAPVPELFQGAAASRAHFGMGGLVALLVGIVAL